MLVDLNGDGKPDVVLSNYRSNGVTVFLGNGDGTFRDPVTYFSSVGSETIAAADVNCDGKPDIVVANGPSVGVLLGNGDGTLSAVQLSSCFPVYSYSFALEDINGDSKIDIVVFRRDLR